MSCYLFTEGTSSNSINTDQIYIINIDAFGTRTKLFVISSIPGVL